MGTMNERIDWNNFSQVLELARTFDMPPNPYLPVMLSGVPLVRLVQFAAANPNGFVLQSDSGRRASDVSVRLRTGQLEQEVALLRASNELQALLLRKLDRRLQAVPIDFPDRRTAN